MAARNSPIEVQVPRARWAASLHPSVVRSRANSARRVSFSLGALPAGGEIAVGVKDERLAREIGEPVEVVVAVFIGKSLSAAIHPIRDKYCVPGTSCGTRCPWNLGTGTQITQSLYTSGPL